MYIYSSDDRSVIEKTKECDKDVYEENGFFYDKNHMMIEGFDAKFNIMINESTTFICGEFRDVLEQL